MLAPLMSMGRRPGPDLRQHSGDPPDEVGALNVGRVSTTAPSLEQDGCAGSDGSGPPAGLSRRRRVWDA